MYKWLLLGLKVQPLQSHFFLRLIRFCRASLFSLPPCSYPVILLFFFHALLQYASEQIFSVQWIQRRQRTLHYTVLCLPKSLVSKCSTDFVAALSSSLLQPLSCKWSWMLFSKECILKRNSHFCLCVLSRTLFSSISSPLSRALPLPPAAAVDCIIDANTVTCVRSGGSSSLLLCYTLSENIKWRKQSHATGGKSACQWSHSQSHFFGIVSSRWLRTKRTAANSSLCLGALPHTLFIFVAHPSLQPSEYIIA